MDCGDIINPSTLPRQSNLILMAPDVALALSYTATLGIARGFFDMFFLTFFEPLFRPSYHKDDFILEKMTLF
ncbi:hypothetical protein KSP40_PGU015798 [Platanthera guangdongensis]|uniref:Uncharacterized protein n=1 Tax=Platanthera guangdongensis TaxID=2320717 RepID=A0ABR2M168_9ASPA